MHVVKPGFKIVVFLIIAAGNWACRSSRIVAPSRLNLMPDFCVPTRMDSGFQTVQIYSNVDSILANDSLFIPYLTKRDILIANASGVLDLVNKLAGLLNNPAAKNKTFLEYTTAIDKNISLVRSEVDGIASEMNCEIIRCHQLSSYLAGLNGKRNTKLTVAAIVAGSITTISPIFIKQTTPQNIVLISGGIITAGLGLLTLNPAGKLIRLSTPNNMLTDIWYGNKISAVYPPSVWHIMNDPGFSNLGLTSKRMLIVLKWTKFELSSPPDYQTQELFFGDGGLFDQAALDTRATMLTEVMAHVNAIKKDLDRFNFSIDDLKMKLIQQLPG